MHLSAIFDFVPFELILAFCGPCKVEFRSQLVIQRSSRERKLRDEDPSAARETQSEIGGLPAA